ncbi:MAG: enoyl-CoA hydratase-related protein [Desulfatibacillaceae bacterium]|nr:enoyl-CoA hydratase-related protein [Desulfatibacillaceae bacterium]
MLTLERPDIRNAITDAPIIDEIVEALEKADSDQDLKVLILTGSGSAFCAGGNIKQMAARQGMFEGSPKEIAQNYRQGIQRIPLAFSRINMPVIAAVNGPAIGAGCDLACMCDIRIASEKAKFGETFAALGLIPGDGGAFFLPRAVGGSKAFEMAYTATILDAQQALAAGLVSKVVPAEKLMGQSLELAEQIAKHPRTTLRMTKQLFREAQHRSLVDVLDMSAQFQGICHHLPEHKKALEKMLKG